MRRWVTIAFVTSVTAVVLACLLAQGGTGEARGTVLDQAGAPIAGAVVRDPDRPGCEARTDASGRFSLTCADPAGSVAVSAAGFHPVRVPVESLHAPAAPPIVLAPAAYREEVIVTASRDERRTTSPAAPVSVIQASDLALAPPVPIDDVLRSVPGFTLFRRSSSRVANPTAQGASLRGLTASGAGRLLVLADGVAVNDPFGGWAYWNRVPVAAIDRIEVVRGGASDLYGADALAGVVQILTARPRERSARIELSAAPRETGRASLFAGLARHGWEATLAGEAATTDGYILVPEDERGPVDTPAGGRSHVLRGEVGYRWSNGLFVRGSGDAYGERRDNGTPLQTNSTDLRQARLTAGGDLAGGRWRISGQAAEQTYRQVFSAIADDRATERLVLQQRVPASQHGLSLEWSGTAWGVDWLVGGDTRDTAATNHEQGYTFTGAPRTPTATPAFQRHSGAFAQVTAQPSSRVSVSAGVRSDVRQRNRDEGWLDGDSAFSPRFSAAWTPSSWAVVRGSIGWSFRSPTLNERYRGFRVGDIQTLPNESLAPERLRTVEGSLLVSASRGSLRTTIFRGDLDDAIANVTLEVTPDLILRRRENVGGVRTIGVELEGEWQLATRATLVGSAALLDSDFVDDPDLAGLRVPQVPAWQTAIGVRAVGPWQTILAAHLRAFGDQFEDDLNTLVLRAGSVVDVTALRPLSRRATIFVSVENLFDVGYDVGRTPVRTIGHPVTAHAGVRFSVW